MDKKIILSTSDQAASIKTVTGWVSADGFFFGPTAADERAARYRGCTHRPCEDCGEPAEKHYIACDKCRARRQRERFEALPAEEWSGEPICLYDRDQFFFDLDDIINFCEGQELKPSDLMLTDTKPEGLHRIDEDYWCDDLPEGGELPCEVAAALEALNRAIENCPTVAYWMNGKKRIVISDDLWPLTD